MSKIKLYASCVLGLTAALCLSSCSTISQDKDARVVSQSNSGAVVLLDPSVDDAMLPTIGESLSQGRVTIYSLEGAAPNTGVSTAMSAPNMMPPGAGLTPPPVGAMPRSNQEVTVYSLDTGAPIMARAPQISPPHVTKLSSPVTSNKQVVKKKTPAVTVKKKTKRPASGMTF